ncbi:MAG: nuclear transport factor 2 family protein [bacterium]|nr:nuclear transport factor 2 family protein [bacterium]
MSRRRESSSRWRIRYAEFRLEDYVQLIESGGRWRIVNKVYRRVPKSR